MVFIIPYIANTCKEATELKEFDIIIVLGNPATHDCKPGVIMKNRVDKGVELLNLGYAKKILFTGNSVRNNCTEADVMAEYAISKGISDTNILRETRANNTYQNAYYSIAQMKKYDYKSAVIITSEPHIKRARAVFSKFDISHTMLASNQLANASSTQLLFWKFGERMILTHHIIFGFPK